MYSVVERGAPNTLEYRIFYQQEGKPISPFHDIPLYSDPSLQYVNMVVEIPRWTNAKMEICKEEALNPIKQDVKKGKLRYVNNVFPYHGYIWNYGAIPQTWEDPTHVDKNTAAKGDNDPLDAVEIGSGVAKRGEIKHVKILGVLAMLDEGETDWKVICIDKSDELADKLHNINDVEEHMPGMLAATRDWFRIYKVPAGKPFNDFSFAGEWKDKEFAEGIIKETHSFWNTLMMNKDTGADVNTMNTSVEKSLQHVTADEAADELKKQPELLAAMPIPEISHKQCFVKRNVAEKVCC